MCVHTVLEAIKTLFLVSGWTVSIYDSDEQTDRRRRRRRLMTLLIRTLPLLHQISTLVLHLLLVPWHCISKALIVTVIASIYKWRVHSSVPIKGKVSFPSPIPGQHPLTGSLTSAHYRWSGPYLMPPICPCRALWKDQRLICPLCSVVINLFLTLSSFPQLGSKTLRLTILNGY